jgi:hypothetical protein
MNVPLTLSVKAIARDGQPPATRPRNVRGADSSPVKLGTPLARSRRNRDPAHGADDADELGGSGALVRKSKARVRARNKAQVPMFGDAEEEEGAGRLEGPAAGRRPGGTAPVRESEETAARAKARKALRQPAPTKTCTPPVLLRCRESLPQGSVFVTEPPPSKRRRSGTGEGGAGADADGDGLRRQVRASETIFHFRAGGTKTTASPLPRRSPRKLKAAARLCVEEAAASNGDDDRVPSNVSAPQIELPCESPSPSPSPSPSQSPSQAQSQSRHPTSPLGLSQSASQKLELHVIGMRQSKEDMRQAEKARRVKAHAEAMERVRQERMDEEEMSSVRQAFCRHYPPPPSNMAAAGRYELANGREMTPEMVAALWEETLKPWSDRWWELYSTFTQVVRDEKMRKPLSRSTRVTKGECARRARAFYKEHGDARPALIRSGTSSDDTGAALATTVAARGNGEGEGARRGEGSMIVDDEGWKCRSGVRTHSGEQAATSGVTDQAGGPSEAAALAGADEPPDPAVQEGPTTARQERESVVDVGVQGTDAGDVPC